MFIPVENHVKPNISSCSSENIAHYITQESSSKKNALVSIDDAASDGDCGRRGNGKGSGKKDPFPGLFVFL